MPFLVWHILFQALGQFVTKWRVFILLAWLVLLIGAGVLAPNWNDVIIDGEFAFLPDDAESILAERFFKKAFPEDLLSSSVVVVAHRRNGPLDEEDEIFISGELRPALNDALETIEEAEAAEGAEGQPDPEVTDPTTDNADVRLDPNECIVKGIRDFENKIYGKWLVSEDKKASLVMVQLTTDFTDGRNDAVVAQIEDVVERVRKKTRAVEQNGKTTNVRVIPPGLQLDISGIAAVGRDMRRAQRDSAKNTETWTVLLVLVLLVVIYRAPLLAIIPLVTVGVATHVSLKLLSLISLTGAIELFNGIETYVTVLIYGAGVDYCLFLIGRYKEELDGGATMDDALANSLGKVGAAVTASAGTVMCGIGMLIFAQFGKFQQAGYAITFGLAIVLLAALTLTPALIRVCGSWAFWPNIQAERIQSQAGWLSPTNLVSSLRKRNLMESCWNRISKVILQRPGAILAVCILAMLPFSILAIVMRHHLSYGLLSELPVTDPSVIGARVVQDHFPAGEVSPVSVLIEQDGIDFSEDSQQTLVKQLTKKLIARVDELSVSRIRSVAAPKGVLEENDSGGEKSEGGFLASVLKKGGEKAVVQKLFVGGEDNQVTRVDVVFKDDPFSRDAIEKLDHFRKELPAMLPDELKDAKLYFVGATPSICDLKLVTDSDQIRIDVLVLLGVFAILIVLLRRPAISAYLIISVFFSYLATLGVTFAVFWAMDPAGFAGLDWKVPMFLFTILIAVGEDYNIFLMTRIDEEQVTYGVIEGIPVALKKTGSIISSCGIIMAGTFSSLLAGTLVGMHQLGFALAFGVLLDTFIVRPVLVPAYLVMLHRGRFGPLTRILGGKVPTDQSAEPAQA